MKLLVVSVIILAVAVYLMGLVTVPQIKALKILNYKIKCLERDRIYVGEGFCAEKSLYFDAQK